MQCVITFPYYKGNPFQSKGPQIKKQSRESITINTVMQLIEAETKWPHFRRRHFQHFPIKNIPSLVQIMACCRPGNKPLSEPMMVRLRTYKCVTQPQWVNKMETNVYDPNFTEMPNSQSIIIYLCNGLAPNKPFSHWWQNSSKVHISIAMAHWVHMLSIILSDMSLLDRTSKNNWC